MTLFSPKIFTWAANFSHLLQNVELTLKFQISDKKANLSDTFTIKSTRQDHVVNLTRWRLVPSTYTGLGLWEMHIIAMLTLIHFDMGICFYLYELKMIQYIWKIVRGWHHQLAHLNIHKDWSRSVFREKCEISKCHIFLISHPIFIIFSLFCRKKCTLSFKID